jgi:hypothetical protein
MVLNELLQRFAHECPMPVMARAVCERVLNPKSLDECFEQVTKMQYTRELLFSSIFEIMSAVVFKAFPTVHAAYQVKKCEIGVSVTSLYNKLNGLEPATSRALVRDIAVDMAQMVADLKGTRRPWLPSYRIKVLDGNCIESTEHRLAVLRDTKAGPLPGKSLVVYDPSLEMAIDVFPCEDGHTQERALLKEVLATIQPNDLWIMDRNFCVRKFLAGIGDRGGRFICRHHKNLPLTPLGPERRGGSIETGAIYEQWVEFDPADGGKVRKIRRIRLKLKCKTRDGDRELFVLTDLSKSAAHAKQVAEMYRKRWTIETMFQELEAHLHSEVNTLGYPRAALFAFCVALVSYNILAVIKAALRAVHGEETIATKVSGYYIAGELTRCYEGMMIALPPPAWSRFRKASDGEFLKLFLTIAEGVNLDRYRKHPRGPKKPPPKRNKHAKSPHVSTARLLRDRR